MTERSRNKGTRRMAVGITAAVCAVVILAVGFMVARPVEPAQIRDANWDFTPLADNADAVAIENENTVVGDNAYVGIAEESIIVTTEGGTYAANQVLVSVDGSISEGVLKDRLAESGVSATEIRLVSKSLDDNQVLVQITYEGSEDPSSVAKKLEKSEFASSAEPNYIQTLCDADEDESVDGRADEQALLGETNDTYRSAQWALDAIGAPTAWDTVRSNGAVTVAVLDSGVDWDHPDLASNLILGTYAKNTYTETTGGNAVDDSQGHGTHVAGIIAAVANNSAGVAGVSYNAKVLPIKVTYGSGGYMYSSDVIEGIDYVVSLKNASNSPNYLKNIRVINLSLGGYNYSENYKAAIKRAWDAGILVVAAAGNEATSETHYPSAYPNVISVSALKQSGSEVAFDSSYSNYGSSIDMAAPGTNIYSTIPNGKYGNKTGTSMAAPTVSAAAALLFVGDMSRSPAQVEALLEDSAEDLGYAGRDNYYGYGALRIDAAVGCKHLAKAKISDIPDQLLTGGVAEPEVTVTYESTVLQKDRDYTVTYEDNKAVGTGKVNVVGAGDYIGSISATFAIYTLDLSGATVDAIADQTFTGEPIEPAVVVKHRGVTLEAGVDYDAEYSNNTNVGTATVTITGKGAYYGSKPVTFRIKARNIAEATVQDISRQVHTGDDVTPDIEAVYGSYPLAKDTDYGLSYENNTQLGMATAIATGKGNFTGTVSVEFEITAEPITKPKSGMALEYNGEEQAVIPESEWYTVEGDRVGVNAGIYTCTITLKEHVYWDDGTNTPYSLDWRISPKRIDVPQADPDAVHTGEALQGIPDGEGYTLSGDVTATDEGAYTVTATLVSRVNYVWSDGTKAPKELVWEVYPERTIDVPTAVSGLVYNGAKQQGVQEGKGYTLTGATAVGAGSYTAKATLTPGYHWATGNDRSVSVDWEIARKPISKPQANDITYDGSAHPFFSSETGVAGVKRVNNISLGGYHSAAITVDGSLYMWGYNYCGQLGDGTTTNCSRPVKVMDGVKSVSLGNSHSAAITVDGSLYLWGYNYSCQLGLGQLGVETTSNCSRPVKVMDGVASVSLGGYHSAAITVDGSLYMWGYNDFGQLGDGTTTNRSRPVKVMDGVKSVSLGEYHSAAITVDGSLYMWGYNYCVQLGDGTTTNRSRPVKVMDGVASVSLGGSHSAAITTDGSLYVWGSNDKGQLGDGTTTNCSRPVKVMDGVKSVSLGEYHSAAITVDGSLCTWGDNGYGQLGVGEPTYLVRSQPVKVMDGVASVSLGGSHSAAITVDGLLYTWGRNDEGRLGNGTTETCVRPILISLLSGLPYDVAVGLYSDAGVYNASVGLLPNYCWEDGTTLPVDVSLTINPLPVALPKPVPVVYNSEQQNGLAESEYYELSGQTTGVDANRYIATATLKSQNYIWEDGSTDAKEIEWTISPKAISRLDVVNDGLVYTGERQIGVKSGEGYTITDGVATAIQVGQYQATLTLMSDNYIWEDGTTGDKEVEWSISGQPIDMSGISFDEASFIYDGEPHSLEIGGDLPEGVAVSYEGNGVSEVGTHDVIAKFTCDASKYAPIPDMSAQLHILPVLVDVPTTAVGLTYDGSLQVGITAPDGTPYEVDGTLSATDAGAYQAVAALRDKHSYEWNTNPTTSEDITLRWVIAPESVVSAEITEVSDRVYSGVGITPKPTVSVNGRELTEGVDYNLSYDDNVEVGTATVLIEGIGNYTDQTSTTFQIVPQDFSRAKMSGVMDRTYNGEEQGQTPTLTLDGKTLIFDEDYRLSYRDNTNAGTAYVIAEGIGHYQGTIETPFEIARADVGDASIDIAGDQFYTGSELRPEVEVSLGGRTLEVGTDCDVEYSGNVNVGTATVTVKGKGNYTGEATATFEVLLASVESASIGVAGDQFYTGSELRPEVEVSLGGRTLEVGTDFDVEYSGNVNVGTATVTVKGKGNYGGEVSSTFEILPADMSSASIDVASEQTYTGQEITPAIQVVSNGTTLVEGVDYDVEYADNVEPGTATVIVRGKGNYSGEASTTFTIAKAPDDKPSGSTTTDPTKQYGADGTPVGPGASAEAAEKAILNLKSDADPAGTVFNGLQAKATKVTKTSVKVTWKKVAGATKYVVYGNKCGKANKYKKLATTNKAVYVAKKVAGQKVKKGTYYKFLIVALNAKGKVVSTSKTIHVATSGGKVGNPGKVKTAAKKNKVAIKVKKAFSLKAKFTPAKAKLKVKKHRAIAYESSNPKIATVSKKGVVKGVKKGTCYIYAYAQNGVCAKVKVTVK